MLLVVFVVSLLFIVVFFVSLLFLASATPINNKDIEISINVNQQLTTVNTNMAVSDLFVSYIVCCHFFIVSCCFVVIFGTLNK